MLIAFASNKPELEVAVGSDHQQEQMLRQALKVPTTPGRKRKLHISPTLRVEYKYFLLSN